MSAAFPLRFRAGGGEPLGDLAALADRLRAALPRLAAIPVTSLVAFLDAYGRRLLLDPGTRRVDGIAFLSAWLRAPNLNGLLAGAFGRAELLDGFVPDGSRLLAARPRGLVAAWMAGNVPTLPVFTFAQALLTKNVALLKLAEPAEEAPPLLAALAATEVEGLTGGELLDAVELVWFPSGERALSEALSRAADVKVVWGGAQAIHAIRALPQGDACVNVEFGPKYSIGVLGRAVVEDDAALARALEALARDVASFDQRACSSPQTVFVEAGARVSLRDVAERLAGALAALPAKREDDAYTTVRILEARAEWAMAEGRDVIASGGTEWSVLLDREVSLKEAVQSRTVFLTGVGSWREVIPLLSPRVQTAGMALGDDARPFAEAATQAGVVRCVRFGLMNVYEAPWDGRHLLSDLVRWCILKP